MPLYSPIEVTQSNYKVTLNKIEINLQKAKQGLKWPKLESDSNSEGKGAAAVFTPTVTSNSLDKAPVYPSSSRNGPKNWDALAEEELKKARTKKTVKTAKSGEGTDLGADENATNEVAENQDSDDEGDALNGFFKKLYKGADPDVKRAMMKSYVESNGTALSTDWSDVGSKTVETRPPDGIEAKKWDS
jgi:suppressor of G2 allele of SKP1